MTKIKYAIKKIPLPVKAMISYIIIIFMQSSISLITTPIFTRMLSTTEYGITTLYNSWYNLFAIFITLNLSSGVYTNALLDYEGKEKRVTSEFLGLSITSATIFSIIYFAFRKYIENAVGLSSYLLTFMLLNFFVYPAWSFIINRKKFDFKYKIPLVISIILFVLDPIFGIVGIKLFPDDKAVAKTIFCNIPTVTVGIISCFIIFIRGKSFYNKEIWKYALKFNLPLVPHYLSNIILSQSDRIMISKILNEAYAGMYSIAYMISSLINGIFTAINSAWTPFVYKNLKANRIKKISENTNILIVVISVICVGVVLIAPEVIKILAPSEYYSAVWAVPPVCIGMYFSFIYTLFGKLEFYHKKNLFIMVATTAAAILNIILNLIFIPIFGYIAAGYTTAIGYFALAIGHYIFMKKIDKRKIYNIKFIIKISIVVVISIFSIIFLYDYVLIRYGIILVALIILALNYKQLLSFAKRYIKEIRGE